MYRGEERGKKKRENEKREREREREMNHEEVTCTKPTNG